MSPEFKSKVTRRVTLFQFRPPVFVVRNALVLRLILYHVLVGTAAVVFILEEQHPETIIKY